MGPVAGNGLTLYCQSSMTEVPEQRSIVRRSSIPSSVSRPVVTPLWPSVVYRTTDADELDQLYEGHLDGYSYAREGHPNADVVAAKLDWMEGVAPGSPLGLITSSGMAAISVVLLGLLSAGDHVVAGDQLYGRSRRLLDDLARLGIGVTLADLGDPRAIAAAVAPSTKLLLAEVMSNPTLRIADMVALRSLATDHDLVLVVDNTFTTPRMFRPMENGADIVVESITKLLAGHADVTLGYIGAAHTEQAASIRAMAVTLGVTPSPFDCWLAERGLHTFELRYDRAERTARRLADELTQLDRVTSVVYPGRPDHPDGARAVELFGPRTGNMVSFTLEGGRADVNTFARAVPQIPFAPTLGDVATTITHPASSSHRGLSAADRQALGITEGLLRVSVGIEETDQLIGEIVGAL